MDSPPFSHAEYEAKLEALHQHANKLADAGSIEEIAEHTVDAQEKTLGFTWAGLSIIEDNFLKSILQRRSGARIPNGSPRLLDSPGIGPRAIRTGETQLVADTRKDADYVGTLMDDRNLSKLDDDTRQIVLRNREYGVGEWASLSELEVPVKIGKSVVALLGAESLELNAFTEHDVKLVEILASHVASAMERIRNKEAMRALAYRLNNLQHGGARARPSSDMAT